MLNMITRQQAITTLGTLANSDLLRKDMCNRLKDILRCIEGEQYGLHWWGACRSDYCIVNTLAEKLTRREELEAENVVLKHMFTPSLTELENNEVDLDK